MLKGISIQENMILTWIDTESRPYSNKLSIDRFVKRDLLRRNCRVVNLINFY